MAVAVAAEGCDDADCRFDRVGGASKPPSCLTMDCVDAPAIVHHVIIVFASSCAPRPTLAHATINVQDGGGTGVVLLLLHVCPRRNIPPLPICYGRWMAGASAPRVTGLSLAPSAFVTDS